MTDWGSRTWEASRTLLHAYRLPPYIGRGLLYKYGWDTWEAGVPMPKHLRHPKAIRGWLAHEMPCYKHEPSNARRSLASLSKGACGMNVVYITPFGTSGPGSVEMGFAYDVFGFSNDDALLLVDGNHVVNGDWHGTRPDRDTFVTTRGVELPRRGTIRARSGETYNHLLLRFQKEGPLPEPALCICCREIVCRLLPAPRGAP